MSSQVNMDEYQPHSNLRAEQVDESAEWLEFHNNFFTNLKNLGIDTSRIQGIEKIKEQLRNVMEEGARAKDPNIMLERVRALLAQIANDFDNNKYQMSQKEDEKAYFNEENQNIHPNVRALNESEESKLDNSALQSSAINYSGKYHSKIPRNEPFTPESEGRRRYQEAHLEITPGERAQKYDDHMPNFHPTEQPGDEDEADQKLREVEENLSFIDRLQHKKWQLRKGAYIEMANMFKNASQGEKYYQNDLDAEKFEYDPLLKYEEWLIRIIRDSNLIAQYEGLNTLFVFLAYSTEVKSTILSTLPDLLDKINHKKHNFRNISIKIIEIMFEKGFGQHISTELLKRFIDARNNDISVFSIDILRLIVEKDKYMGSIGHLDHIFKGILHALLHRNDKIRESGLKLLKEIYIRVSDD